MSLPDAWVEKIFMKLSVTFGRDFLMRWEGVPLPDVKRDWAHELSGFQQNPGAIAHGLEHCVSLAKPPTVHEFKTACSRRPDPAPVALLPAAPANPERVAAEVSRWSNLRKGQPFCDEKAWAKRIVERHARGEKIGVFALKAAREVAGVAVFAA